MYYGSQFMDVTTDRVLRLYIESDNGVYMYVDINLYFTAKNNTRIISGEDCYSEKTGKPIKLFYAYDGLDDIRLSEKIQFTCVATEEGEGVEFIVSEDNSFYNTNKWLDESKVSIIDSFGVKLKPSAGVYKIRSNEVYTIHFTSEYLSSIKKGSRMFYIHTHLGKQNAFDKFRITRRKSFSLY